VRPLGKSEQRGYPYVWLAPRPPAKWHVECWLELLLFLGYGIMDNEKGNIAVALSKYYCHIILLPFFTGYHFKCFHKYTT